MLHLVDPFRTGRSETFHERSFSYLFFFAVLNKTARMLNYSLKNNAYPHAVHIRLCFRLIITHTMRVFDIRF